MRPIFSYYHLLLLISTVYIGHISARHFVNGQPCPPDYDGPWGPGVQCPCQNPRNEKKQTFPHSLIHLFDCIE